jgi:hypothetical protein
MNIRRLLRFRLRTLLILVAIVAALVVTGRSIVLGYRAENAALRKLREGRFAVQTKIERPWWIPASINARLGYVFDRVVLLSVDGRPIDFDRGIVLTPANFRDEHLAPIAHFRKLKCLDLSGTQITSNSLVELARLKSLKALDIRGSHVQSAAISEFQRQRPDCLVCDSQGWIFALVDLDDKVTINQKRVHLYDAERLLTEARRGPDAFGNSPQLYVHLEDEDLPARRAQMVAQLRTAARNAGYPSFQVTGSAAGPP